jgi:hypothetical protein
VALSDLHMFVNRVRDPTLAIEIVATLVTGVCAILAAFELSMPDRSRAWAWLPLPPFVVWVATSGYECYRNWIVHGPSGWEIGESAECFRFIVLTSIPIGIALLFALRRALPLDPIRVAMMGGLGVAAISAFVLQFFHPFDVTVMDLAIHLVAVGLVIVGAALAERFVERRASQRDEAGAARAR